MSNWRPMTEHAFPWEHRKVIVLAYVEDDPETIEVHLCEVGEHGAFFFRGGWMLSLHENGWIPYAWQIDDCPPRHNPDFPPMLTDYLTQAGAP